MMQAADTSKITTVSLGILPGDWPAMPASRKAAAITARHPRLTQRSVLKVIDRLDAKHPVRPPIEYRERVVAVPAGAVTSAPNFATGQPAASWRYSEGSFQNVCVTSGYDLVMRLRSTLGLPAAPVWDQTLIQALIQRVQTIASSDPTWAPVAVELRTEQAGSTVGPMALHVGVFLAYYAPNGRRFDSIRIDPGAIAPTLDVPIAAPSRGQLAGLRCFDETLDPDPRAATTEQVQAAIAHSTTGVRLEPGRSAPASATVTIDAGQQGASALTVVLLSVLLLGGAAALLVKR